MLLTKMADREIYITVDVEPDCPPFLNTHRGITEGMDRVLSLFASKSVKATFFVTAQIAVEYPEMIQELIASGHELGSHGLTHMAFDTMDCRTAEREIRHSMEILSRFAPIDSFRAPYLRFPDAYLRLLEDTGYIIDSSQAKYKPSYYGKSLSTKLKRLPVSITSSALRLPAWLRRLLLNTLSSPVVLFIHPWELVNLTRERLRLDCRFKTGMPALEGLRSTIALFEAQKARFLTMRDNFLFDNTPDNGTD
jgi:peptidoglycan/xylan/chitin deacetylase (PgdA/CDA1 family)